ncbi:hypothetical protein PUW87_01105 [Metamycoplasma hyosynoviae]|uniref:hypothetical protein n=1 Tax=Metamycoplasma hyosynoviae TaxID=29559 RepID=UPI0023589FF7|nr:hypothetical protein [Metamycoplasma hyosynoviae]MDC8917318.1 hypothetical protein [Metamycoplasma hyosynoviae]MDD7893534.1 hypothetical protein [Metamycoplasma hyosynoviae]MDD7907221.1 hypothetical protein [Metamycoplasma hyosynoviae]
MSQNKFSTIKDYLLSANNATQDVFDIVGFNKPNSKKAYLRLGAKIQANTLAFKIPEVKFTNQEAQKLWDQVINKNRFLEIIQQLETNLYEFGYYAIGIMRKGDNYQISLAKVEKYKLHNNKLIKLAIVIDNFSSNSENFELIKEYDLTKNTKNDFVSMYAKQKATKEIKSLSQFPNLNFSYLNEFSDDFIPWVVIKNNYLGNSEIDDVDQSLFQMLDNCLECILRDNFWSNPFIFVIDNYNMDSATDVKDAIYDFGKRVISSSTMALNQQIGNPIEFHQGNSNTTHILQKVDKLNYLIKDQMFFKMNTGDFGTKNMHNAEFENINSNFNDYVEAKANSRESYYQDFVELFLKLANLQSDFEIIVPNSTKYLKSKEAIYNVDSNGVLLNQNPQAQIAASEEKESDD